VLLRNVIKLQSDFGLSVCYFCESVCPPLCFIKKLKEAVLQFDKVQKKLNEPIKIQVVVKKLLRSVIKNISFLFLV